MSEAGGTNGVRPLQRSSSHTPRVKLGIASRRHPRHAWVIVKASLDNLSFGFQDTGHVFRRYEIALPLRP